MNKLHLCVCVSKRFVLQLQYHLFLFVFIVFLVLYRYSFVKIKDCLCLVATDTIPQISNELGVVLEVVKTIDASQLQGVVCAHPMDSDRHVKLFPAAHVTTQKGSGIVHTAPAHGLEDFTIGQKHSLDVVNASKFCIFCRIIVLTIITCVFL